MTEISKTYSTNLAAFLSGQVNDFESALSNPKMIFAQECLFARQQILKNSFSQKVASENQPSLKNAILNVAAVGLSLNPATQHAFLVPRDGNIVLDISYRGFIKIATDTGIIKWCRAELVYENDEFLYNGAFKEPSLKANPFKPRGDVVGVYCVAKTTDGDFLVDVMDVEEINKIRDTSKAYQSAVEKGRTNSVWHTWYGEMAKKSVIKRASKTWPQSDGKDRLDRAVAVVNEHEGLALAEYTVEDKERLDEYMSEGLGMEMYVWLKSGSDSRQMALYNSFPKGQITKLKQQYDTMMSDAQRAIGDYLDSFESSLQEDEIWSVMEVLDEMSEPVREHLRARMRSEMLAWLDKGYADAQQDTDAA